MQSLPLELREAIVAQLISPPADDGSVLTHSTAQERQDVYNVRQTCRELAHSAWRTFRGIIQDVPFFCTAKSLDHLDQLLQHVPQLAEKFDQLTLAGSNITRGDEQHERYAWVKASLVDNLKTLLSRLPNLRKIRCLPLHAHISMESSNGEQLVEWQREREAGSHSVLKYLYAAMLQSPVAKTLTSFSIRTTEKDLGPSYVQVRNSPLTELPPGLSSLHPHLQHLTIDTSSLILNGNIGMPTPSEVVHLETLTIIFDPTTTTSLGGSLHNPLVRALQATEPKRLVIKSHNFEYINGVDLRVLLVNFSPRKTPIQLVALRRLGLMQDPGDTIQLSKSFQVEELELQDIRRKRHSSWPEYKGRERLCRTGWETVPWLWKFAKVVRVRYGKRELLMGPDRDHASSSVWWDFSDPSDSSDSSDVSDSDSLDSDGNS